MLPMPQSATARKSATLWLTVVVCIGLLAAAGIAIYREYGVIATQAAQLAERSRENDALRRRVQDLTAAPAGPAVSEPAPAPHSAARRESGPTAEALAQAEQRAQRLQESLAQSTADVARFEERITDLQSRADSLVAENRRLTAAAEADKKELAAANQAMETIRAEQKATSERLAQLEIASAKWKQDGASAKLSAAQNDKTISDLEDVLRRREMYLANILRRYRDLTEQFRAVSVGSTSAASPETSRIQNAIALTEDDLRQIRALDVQAQRLEKKLAK